MTKLKAKMNNKFYINQKIIIFIRLIVNNNIYYAALIHCPKLTHMIGQN